MMMHVERRAVAQKRLFLRTLRTNPRRGVDKTGVPCTFEHAVSPAYHYSYAHDTNDQGFVPAHSAHF